MWSAPTAEGSSEADGRAVWGRSVPQLFESWKVSTAEGPSWFLGVREVVGHREGLQES